MLDSIFFYLQTMITRFIYFVYPKNIIKLKTLRENLSKEILDFVNIHIREADPKYDQERILFAKELERGDSEQEIVMRRSSMRKHKNAFLEDEISTIIDQSS